MTVYELAVKLQKRGRWCIFIMDRNGKNKIACCDNEFPLEDLDDAIKQLQVRNFKIIANGISISATCPMESTYQSAERCQMDGYRKIYSDSGVGPVYAKEVFVQNPYSGETDSHGYVYANVLRF